jgi:HlyD family secretion protein
MERTGPTDTMREIRKRLLGGGAGAAVLIFGLGGWAVSTEIAGAVFASGHLVVDSNVKKVQHLQGGVVSELKVRDGDRVQAGDLLVRLDETLTRANLTIIDKALTELAARQARGAAERDGADAVVFPESLLERADNPDTVAAMRGEELLFAMRRSARDGRKAQLRQRIEQLNEEARGIGEQVKAKDAELSYIARELAGVRELWQKNLIPIMRLTALERDSARIAGERGALISALAQAKGKVTETQLQILQIDQTLSAEIGKELSEIRARAAELAERRIAAEDNLKRVEIRAPRDGLVHQSSVHTVGGVIPAGEPIMLIVPADDALVVEAALAPQEIDRIQIGHSAVLRFTSLNQGTTPEIVGDVIRISADTVKDAKTGAPFYTARIALTPGQIARLEGIKLIPGMPVDVFIQTGERSVATYLTKPLLDHLALAWRER